MSAPDPDAPNVPGDYGRPRVTFPLPPGAPKAPCRSCKAPVVWIQTPNGRRMPVDPGTGESHFATCPQAADWRKPR